MSKNKLHIASAFIEALKGVKPFLLPAIVVFAVNGFNVNIRSFTSILEALPLLIVTIVFFAAIASGIFKWYTYRYWIEENQLKVEYGMIFKKKRFVPLERIQSLNYEEGIIHRLFNVQQISVETAGGGSSGAEVVLTAVTKYAAADFERNIKLASTSLTLEEELQQVNVGNILYKMSSKDLVLLATTSNGTGVVLAGIAALLSQFSKYIPFEKISEQFAALLTNVYIAIVVIAFLVIVLAWGISLLMTYLTNYQFTLSKNEHQLEITRGLLEKKKSTIIIDKIQAINIIESPIQQLFGFAKVSIEHASSNTNDASNKLMLLPFIKKNKIEHILQHIDEHVSIGNNGLIKSPRIAKSLFYQKYIWAGLIAVTSLTYFASPYFLLLSLLFISLVLLGLAQHKAAGFELSENNLKVQYRRVNKVLFLVHKNKIQALEVKQNPFQKRKMLYTGNIHIMGGIAGVKVKVIHQLENETMQLMEFIKR